MDSHVHEQSRLLDRIRGTMEDAARRERSQTLDRTAVAQVEFQASVLACLEVLCAQVQDLADAVLQMHEDDRAADSPPAGHHGPDPRMQLVRCPAQDDGPLNTEAILQKVNEVSLHARVQRLEDVERALKLSRDVEQRVCAIAQRLEAQLRRGVRRERNARRKLRKEMRRLEARLDDVVLAGEGTALGSRSQLAERSDDGTAKGEASVRGSVRASSRHASPTSVDAARTGGAAPPPEHFGGRAPQLGNR